MSSTSHGRDWAVGLDVANVEADIQNANSATGVGIWAATEVAHNIWLNFEYASSGTMDTQVGGSANYVELKSQELRLYMEGQRFFSPTYSIFLATGFSRFDTETSDVPAAPDGTTSVSGFTYGAKVGMQYHMNESFGLRLGYFLTSDVAEGVDSVSLSGLFLGFRVDL